MDITRWVGDWKARKREQGPKWQPTYTLVLGREVLLVEDIGANYPAQELAALEGAWAVKDLNSKRIYFLRVAGEVY